MDGVFTRLYKADALAVDTGEILRYAGVKELTDEVGKLLEQCISEARALIDCRVCYKEFEICLEEDEIDLGFARAKSAKLAKNLSECCRIILFSATVGGGIDRLIKKYSVSSPAKALFMQAIGTQQVEALCDLFNRQVASEAAVRGYSTRPRFSPGYGDLSLDLQRDIFESLDLTKWIGITLNDSLLMTPTKSVTAIIGLKRR